MTENTRTATYIGVALVLLIVAALINRKPEIEADPTLAGKVLFPTLKSPDDVGGLEIVTSADGVAQTEFTLKRDAAGWSIPSHGGYPADAEKQVANAASSLIDLKALSMVTTSASLHAEYGVVDPENTSPGAEGIGKLVKVLDKSGNTLARLVIGKKDSDAGTGSDGGELWFVRVSPQDPVYRVALPSAQFSTNFEDWIETDLLKLDPWEISEVTLKDYIFDVAPDLTGQVRQNYDQLSTIELAFNEKDSKWVLEKLIEFENDQPKPVELASDEELNSVRLNEMKTALDDLKIVGVRKKPAGMSANLRANKSIFNESEALQSLAERGFYAVRGEGGEPEILSSDGEVLVRMKDGIEYTLRFGGVAGVGTEAKDAASADKDKQTSAGSEKEDEKQGATLNRFIMVSARFNKDLIPDPELQPLPGDSNSTEKSEEAKTSDAAESKGADAEPKQPEAKGNEEGKAGQAGEDTPADADDSKSAALFADETLQFVKFQEKPADIGNSQKKGDAKTATKSTTEKGQKPAATKQEDTSKSAGPNADDATTKSAPVKADDAKVSDSAKPATETKADDKANADAAKTDADDADADDAKVDDAKADDAKTSTNDEEELALRRKQIETENERKKKEYDEKVKKGEAKAQELNARFAEWYYVVSEETYKKIHLNRGDVIKKKAPEKKEDSADAADPLKVPSLNDLIPNPDDAAKNDEEPAGGELRTNDATNPKDE
jgi:hypothetical protein